MSENCGQMSPQPIILALREATKGNRTRVSLLKQLPNEPRHVGTLLFAHLFEGTGAGDSCLDTLPAETVLTFLNVTQSCLNEDQRILLSHTCALLA